MLCSAHPEAEADAAAETRSRLASRGDATLDLAAVRRFTPGQFFTTQGVLARCEPDSFASWILWLRENAPLQVPVVHGEELLVDLLRRTGCRSSWCPRSGPTRRSLCRPSRGSLCGPSWMKRRSIASSCSGMEM
jgi:hypothetical protein